jgi:hypothetical protein
MWGPALIQNLERQDDARLISAVPDGERQASVAPNAAMCSGQSPPNLFLEHFFDLPDLFFDFAGPVFGFASSF